MSSVSDLLEKHCPNGVEYRTVGSVCQVFSGFAFPSARFNAEGIGLPLVRVRDVNTGPAGVSYSGDFDPAFLVKDGDILIGMDGDFRAVRWTHGRAVLNQRVCRLQKFSPDVSPDFLRHVIQGELDRIHRGIEGATVKHLSSKDLLRSRIPVPPLAVQLEIAHVLDTFKELAGELEAGLRGELLARRTQYTYYRNQLLSFKDSSVEWAPLHQVGQLFRGRRFTKDDVVAEGLPSIHYGEIYTHYGVSARDTVSMVDTSLAPSLKFASTGDVVIAAVGETVEDVGKAVAWLGDDDVAIHDDCYAFRHSLNPTFVAYYFQSDRFHCEKERHVARAKVKRISAAGLGQVSIPLPSSEEQQRVVDVLDGYETLVNDLASRLAMEIATRRKQYEFYRNRLLSFRERL